MTKNEEREIKIVRQARAHGLGNDYMARALSAMIRAARSTKSRQELLDEARRQNVIGHAEFII